MRRALLLLAVGDPCHNWETGTGLGDGKVRVGVLVRARLAGDCEPREGDLAVLVGVVGDHPSDGVAGTHS